MKTILVAITALALAAAPALAQQDHGAHHPDAPASSDKMDMSKMTPEEMHKHCTAMMGGKMQGTPKHDHSAEKLGHGPTFNPPSEAEMKAMHEKCAAEMVKPKP
ncbi:hypothetical protein [Phenylobacterium sp.]|uniref:hypothetical protein n=1 Tax=Phenylobacterium sp. TaxID=1871053 RepID=UPI0027379DF7|nr:hypothetical protein [Phenylobacterium sp.]MDP3867469.1 hypothetical protein [Phenylobacterium sp.]